MIATQQLHVATDWTAFGLFFLGLIGTVGGFVAFVMRRMDQNRSDWKEFVANEVHMATTELKHEVATLTNAVSDNSTELREQGKAVARIEGRLGSQIQENH